MQRSSSTLFRSLLRQRNIAQPTRRFASKQTPSPAPSSPPTPPPEPEYDFEHLPPVKPRLVTISNTLRWILIPGVLGYAVFVYDFGPQDHVFRPPRRWLQTQIDAFWTLSPAEQKLLNADATDGSTSFQEELKQAEKPAPP
ncbi:uncharacterized protein STEHIDRAFT_169029 [Stereum hirsutum FP-91666 SS1]|uniref:uncharacterized protein n=1 Tax=Stereum hirsutum (strain FP-91666) TaxID=721885 RepID=UPI000444A259|nr:uncharacterized protein STEHIDRAFT_169029 [Stereum hirsutum FP-91666 SS1]EIM86016.1 hypothetical protein STEHIDRAFT_169029 [Stereum hirsutum FP-91666 SS1]